MNTTPFTFSIRTATREASVLYKKHWSFFLAISLISIAVNLVGGKHAPAIVDIIGAIAAFVWSLVWTRASLAAARGEAHKLSLEEIKNLLPSLMDIAILIGIGILGGLLVLCGFILLIIPGVYVAIRLSFARLAYFDRKEGIRASLRYSWDITKGPQFWTIVLTGLAIIGICILGAIALGVGLFVAYPIAMIVGAKLYVALAKHHNGQQAIIEQPTEIPADLPHAEVV